jgi:hypothetical protein
MTCSYEFKAVALVVTATESAQFFSNDATHSNKKLGGHVRRRCAVYRRPAISSFIMSPGFCGILFLELSLGL